jgi:PAS domain S-box-containing protein
MSGSGSKGNSKRTSAKDVEKLRSRLSAAEDTLQAIRTGQIDAVLVQTLSGEELLTIGRAENGYRVIVEAMNEGAVTIASDGTILYCNRCFASIVRLPLEKIIGSSVYDFVPPASRATFDAAFAQAQASSRRAELTLRGGDGSEVPVFLSLANFQEYGSRAICMVVTDLTEQKRQEEIVAAGRLANIILEQSVEPIAVCNSDGQIVLASQALHRLCGRNPLLQDFDNVLPLSRSAELHRHGSSQFSIRDIIAGNSCHGLEVCFGNSDGEQMHLLLSAAPTPLPNEERHGCVVALLDIEERRRTEEALRRSERLAATGRLAATIAHEINNPLEAITNLLFLLSSHPSLSPGVKAYADAAQSELGRVAHITKQTLTFHRSSNAPQPVNLAEVIDSVVFLYSRSMLAKNIMLHTDCRFAGQIVGFPNELRQVISNLVENAVEACPQGGKLWLRCYPDAERNNSHKPGVRIVIADNGPGIRPDHAHRVFEPFFTTKGERGTGLGLWVSHGIIVKHGGFIRLRSCCEGRRTGTVFRVFLPITYENTGDFLADAQIAAD